PPVNALRIWFSTVNLSRTCFPAMAFSFLKGGPKTNARHIRTGTCDARVDMAQPKCSFWKRRNDPAALQFSLADRTDSFFAGIHRQDVSSRRVPGSFLAVARILFTAPK